MGRVHADDIGIRNREDDAMTPQQKLTDIQAQVADLRRRLEQADHNLEEYRRLMEQATEGLKKANARLRRLEIAGDAMAKRFVWDLPVNVDWRKAKEEA